MQAGRNSLSQRRERHDSNYTRSTIYEQVGGLPLIQCLNTFLIIKFSDFPDDLQAAEALLYNMGVTHIVSLSPAQLELPNNVMNSITHRHINIPTYRPESVILALSETCDFIHDAINSGGQVLVYCVIESRACIVVTAYCELYIFFRIAITDLINAVMYSREISAPEALATIEDGLYLIIAQHQS
jgi:hypothetical protein